VEEKHIQV
jgi:hypothetical protein